MSDELAISTEGPVAILTIDRKARRNALGSTVVAELARRLTAIDQDPDLRASVITGVAPGFSAGSDLKELAGLSLDQMCEHEKNAGRLCRLLPALQKPVIAAVEGFALGGGFILAASCDVVVTADDAKWWLPEVSIGWIPPWGIEALTHRVGPSRARRLVWGATQLSGEEAVEIGVADFTRPHGDALSYALTIAGDLARLPAAAVSSTKLYFSCGASWEGNDALASHLFKQNCVTSAAAETFRKFGVEV